MILNFLISIVTVYLTYSMSESVMWSALSELVAARIVIPLRMLITSSVLRVDFKKAFNELFIMVDLKSLLI